MNIIFYVKLTCSLYMKVLSVAERQELKAIKKLGGVKMLIALAKFKVRLKKEARTREKIKQGKIKLKKYRDPDNPDDEDSSSSSDDDKK